VVACTVKKTEPYLFRSYDHPHPNPGLDTNELNRHLNPGPASEVALWQAGRATSAAPGWFPAIEINQNWYEDGAMAECNNPIMTAYNEVKQMLPASEPRVIISIGTGIKKSQDEPEENSQRGSSRLSWYMNKANRYSARLGDSEKAHAEYEEKLRDSTVAEKPAYFRFNVPSTFEGTSLGDWKGEKGATTKEAIRQPTEAYVEGDIEIDIKQCAQMLVDIRRKRAETARWETFASDTKLYYLCPLGDNNSENENKNHINNNSQDNHHGNNDNSDNKGCKGLRFDSRLELRQHAIERHGFVWRIRCGHFPRGHLASQPEKGAQPLSHIGWTCVWDGCEKAVSAFDERLDFESHLTSEHGYDSPEVQESEQQFEEWLDKGRKISDKGRVHLRHVTRSQRWDTGLL
jgi:hypothetical protein